MHGTATPQRYGNVNTRIALPDINNDLNTMSNQARLGGKRLSVEMPYTTTNKQQLQLGPTLPMKKAQSKKSALPELPLNADIDMFEKLPSNESTLQASLESAKPEHAEVRI